MKKGLCLGLLVIVLMMTSSKAYSEGLSACNKNKLYAVVYSESSSNTEEIRAVSITFINLIRELGFEKALRRSCAYTKRSKQYKRAERKAFAEVERKKYDKVVLLVNECLLAKNLPGYKNFENVKDFGRPKWAKGEGITIGKQVFWN